MISEASVFLGLWHMKGGEVESPFLLRMVVHAFRRAHRAGVGGGGRWASKLEGSLVYRVSSRTAKDTQKPCPKQTRSPFLIIPWILHSVWHAKLLHSGV